MEQKKLLFSSLFCVITKREIWKKKKKKKVTYISGKVWISKTCAISLCFAFVLFASPVPGMNSGRDSWIIKQSPCSDIYRTYMRNDCTQQCLVLIKNLVLLLHHVPFFLLSPAFCSNCKNPLFFGWTSFAYLKRRLIRRHFCNSLFSSALYFISFFPSRSRLLQLISDRHLNRFLPISISGPCLLAQTKEPLTKGIKTIRSADDCVIVLVLTNMFLFLYCFFLRALLCFYLKSAWWLCYVNYVAGVFMTKEIRYEKKNYIKITCFCIWNMRIVFRNNREHFVRIVALLQDFNKRKSLAEKKISLSVSLTLC